MDQRSLLKTKIENFIKSKMEYEDALKSVDVLRKCKNDAEEEVNELLQNLNLENKVFVVNDCKVQQKRAQQVQGLSLKFLESALENYSYQTNEKFDIKKVIEFIKLRRPRIEKCELKIYS